MLDSWWNYSKEVINIAKEASSHVPGISDRISDSIDNKCIQFPNWEKISLKEIKEEFENSCNSIIKKYWFSEEDSIKFKQSIVLHPFWEVPGHPSLRGMSCSSVICTWDTDSLSDLSPHGNIYVNPNLVDNRDFYFAVLFHEIDHHAFYFKKFYEKHIDSITSVEWKRLQEIIFILLVQN